ncbi:SIMPL domain-containing protein [Thiomicrospira sp. R3]|uniref:SIMPL domain-containing protein n=1 Tax=Thiomicrospira sp. R3 TaxID=3035472 RepID=UPI00259B4CDF|nr:SIMPL domain-containing protein [Thiomicrospira sp. R3]WFE69168.1 SIMPL domain-containing protein [Thiomicrospira sp. R3]
MKINTMRSTLSMLSLALSLALLPGLVMAQHKIHFAITEQAMVENDRVIVQFNAQFQADDAQAVSQKVNQMMRQAISQLSAVERSFIQTGNYSVRPQHNRSGVITHWQGQQQLTLTLPVELDISEILSRLQPYLSYQSMQADISHQKRTEAEQALIQQALKNYQHQAKLIAKSFNQAEYTLLETHIQTQRQARHYAQPRMALASSAMESAPIIEAGENIVSVNISGILALED